jgi:TolA-binding protein
MAAAAPRLPPSRPEALYDDAWDALRASDFARAAVGFAAVLQSDPSGPLADEATFWRATALARSGSSDRAVATFRDFLARYPASPRRGEASAMLGWLLVDVGQPEEAARHFRAAANDSHQPVRASARHGLQSLPAAPPGR